MNFTVGDDWRGHGEYDRQVATLGWDRCLGGATSLRTTATYSSTDGGESWAAARDLHDAPPSGPPGSNTFHGAAWAGDSTLVVAWMDGRDRDKRRIERAVC